VFRQGNIYDQPNDREEELLNIWDIWNQSSEKTDTFMPRPNDYPPAAIGLLYQIEARTGKLNPRYGWKSNRVRVWAMCCVEPW
jgi:hypothetical protein